MRVNVGRKENKDGDFVGREERVREIGGTGVQRRWGQWGVCVFVCVCVVGGGVNGA